MDNLTTANSYCKYYDNKLIIDQIKPYFLACMDDSKTSWYNENTDIVIQRLKWKQRSIIFRYDI